MTSDIFDNGFTIDDYPLLIEKISEQEFTKVLDNSLKIENSTVISGFDNIKNAKLALEGAIEVNENNLITKIHAKNGNTVNLLADFEFYNIDENTLSIIMDDGYSGISLNTGKFIGTYRLNSFASPNKLYRFSGTAYEGCAYPFVEKYINDEWIAIIRLDDIFNQTISKQDNQLEICGYQFGFFENNQTAYIKVAKNKETDDSDYYKIDFKFDKFTNSFDLTTIPQKPLPLEVAIDFDNYEQFTHLNKNQAKFFAGLYPTAKEIVILGKVSYNPNTTSLIMTFSNTENEHELITHLINIDKNGNIIDTLNIAYDEIAESWSKTTSALQKEQITVTDFHDGDPTQENSYKIDDKGYFYLVDSKDFTQTNHSNDN
ncbi:hypothetical protein LP090_09060 [Moraxella bovis]|uniref:hypothetical protein n=1 Tax=Moraxella bovis TaxID=476 RepID=UPI002225DA2D|nr:hypothetical protein [Moraxella bovis]UYZ69237.1 hypothetical protein LP122_03915 [Moraxella bovis]UYZ71610.1 hypothetical protein LP089_03960 [Moraxella bovis]UYZ72476.1 hypothetical protein LP105_08700 [Moraxella bovis]UZA14905.1 hypothetical protein LP102_03900 [Moraxella bovis]UZA26733.1 hypothetical protein LP119_08930 [Moraxella bovis]